jgi:malonyl-CoA decarboxylase
LTRPPAAGTGRNRANRRALQVISIFHALLSERGEVSGVRLATEALNAFQALDDESREAFFDLFADQLLPDPEHVARASDAYRLAPSPATLRELQAAVESPRQELFRRLNLARGGMGALIEMRRQLLMTLDQHPERSAIDTDLVQLFRSWFNGGFLVLQRIDWKTSALVLERLIQFEAVHQIQGWGDLRRRLEADRRCYAFFHPALPDEPLIFIEVALTRGMSSKVQPLIDPQSPVMDPELANCAIFYSITNCLVGLRGVSFGNLLIKQVVEDLTHTFPRLSTFATLSPIPDFRKWLAAAIAPGPSRVTPPLSPELAALVESSDYSGSPAVTPGLKNELLRLCAYYLVKAHHGRAPLDPVARFHLANGARLERLNWMSDTSPAGVRRSFGLMVNYVYRLPDLERNHEAYAREYRVVASRDMERLAAQAPPLADVVSRRPVA